MKSPQFFASLACVAIAAAIGCGNSSNADEGVPDESTDGTGGTTGPAGGSTGGGGAAAGGGGVAAGGGGSTGAAGMVRPAGACAKLVFADNANISNTIGAATPVDQFTWQDSKCQPRTAAMARQSNGYLRQFSYQVGGKTRTVTGTNVNGWNGWGYVINHGLGYKYDGAPGTNTKTFGGDHHAIYEYKFTADKAIEVTLSWFFATGRDNPVVAISYVMPASAIGAGGDTRTPYGDMMFEGDDNNGNTVISGAGWGDHKKFITTKAPLTLNSTWDYTANNTVPYTFLWTESPDAEMGIVQTQTYTQHDAGGYWFYKNWGKTSANQVKDTGQGGLMPIDWNWPYQMCQYELCYVNGAQDPACADQTTGSHRMAWGTNYGAVGGADATGQYPALGDAKKLSGHPYQSYSVFGVLGTHADKAVFNQVTEIETVQQTKLAATVGTVDTDGPGGVSRTDTVKLAPVGYDHRYSTWNLTAAGDKVAFTATVSAGSLNDPVVVISNFNGTSVPAITVDGAAMVADVDFFASIDAANKKLWITFRPGWTGTRTITVG